jgi:hypothetical protein
MVCCRRAVSLALLERCAPHLGEVFLRFRRNPSASDRQAANANDRVSHISPTSHGAGRMAPPGPTTPRGDDRLGDQHTQCPERQEPAHRLADDGHEQHETHEAPPVAHAVRVASQPERTPPVR